MIIMDSVGGSHGRRDEDDTVPANEEHGDGPLGGLEHLLVRLLVNLSRGDGLLDVPEDHVEMLVVGVEAALQLALVPHLDVNPLVQGEPHQVQGLLHGAYWRGLDIISHHKVFYKTFKLSCRSESSN